MKRQVRDNDLILDYLQSVQESRQSLLARAWASPRTESLKRIAVAAAIVQFVAFAAIKISQPVNVQIPKLQAARAPASASAIASESSRDGAARTAKIPMTGPLTEYLDLVAVDSDPSL